MQSVDDILIDNEAAIEDDFWQFERIKKTAETYAKPIINVAEAPIVKLVKKRGPKPKKRNGSSQPIEHESKRQREKIRRQA